MSEFAFFRFVSLNLLTQEEKVNKSEMISITEEVLDAKGIECDAKIAKVSEETIREVLSEVRKRRRKRANQVNESAEEQEITITSKTPDWNQGLADFNQTYKRFLVRYMLNISLLYLEMSDLQLWAVASYSVKLTPGWWLQV